MKKILSALLLSAMLLSTFAACSGGDTTSQPGETTANAGQTDAAETTAAEETAPSAYDYLPEKDYDGYEFKILYPTGIRYFPRQIDPTESNGEIINDSAYDRNMAVEGKYNVKTVGYPLQLSAVLATARQHVQAGDHAFDVMYSQMDQPVSFAVEKYAIDLAEQEYINLDMPWYNRDMNEGMQLYGKQYIVSGDFMNCLLANTYAIYFNTRLAYDVFDLPNLYDLALGGGWTIDKFMEYINGTEADLNGDGTLGSGDQFGYAFNGWNQVPMVMMYAMGQRTTEINAKGDPELVLNCEKTQNIAEKLAQISANPAFCADVAVGMEQWKASNVLFYSAIFMQTDLNFREIEDDYGVLPMPKYDEAQEKYLTSVNPLSYIYTIPITVTDKERTTVLFEAYCYEGYNYVRPGFYEIALKTKYSRDDASAQVYDIILNGRVVDFGFMFDGSVGMFNIMNGLMQNGSADFASAYASREAAALAQYEKIMAAYKD